jgi:ribosomal protein S18 acetylase RimI-like enzyme
MNQVQPKAILEFNSVQLADILTRSFEGYLMPVQMNAESFERRFRAEHLDAVSSFVYLQNDAPVGIILVARRGKTSRIAAMGVVAEARGQGLGRIMLQKALNAAQVRGDRSVVLEVFEQNKTALSLYQSLGFEILRPLVGYSRPAGRGEPQNLIETDALEFSRVAATEGENDLPWMLTAENFAGQSARAFQLEDAAFALASDTSGSNFILWALVVRKHARNRGLARRLMNGLSFYFANKECRVVQVIPKNLAPGFFERLGFSPLELWQFEMVHRFGV